MVKVYHKPEVYTSYVGRVPALLKSGFRREEMTLIVRHRMPHIDKRIRNCQALAPFPALYEGYKKGLIDEFSFRILYRDWIDRKYSASGTIDRIRELGLKVFLCYEVPSQFCHRHVFAEWLTANGMQCEEWQPTYDYPLTPWQSPKSPPPPQPTTPLLPPPPPPITPPKYYQPSLFD